MTDQIVTWATPVQRMERTAHAIGEELETGSRARADKLIAEHLGHVRDLMAFLAANPVKGADGRQNPNGGRKP
jgi:DNA-binding GntR family transcriptional regulator